MADWRVLEIDSGDGILESREEANLVVEVLHGLWGVIATPAQQGNRWIVLVDASEAGDPLDWGASHTILGLVQRHGAETSRAFFRRESVSRVPPEGASPVPAKEY